LETSQIQILVYPDKLMIMNAAKHPPELPVKKLGSSPNYYEKDAQK